MSRLNDVNTTDIRAAISLGCRTMCSVFNADDHGIPFFGSSVTPEARFSYSGWHDESHVPGRHLNALLNAEDAAGIRIDEQCVDKHAAAAFFSYAGPVPFPLNREAVGGPLSRMIAHNLREGFHALAALTRFRSSREAARLAEESVAAVFRYWDPERDWDIPALESLGLKVTPSNLVIGIGRSIGPLVKYFRSAGYGPALRLALILKDKMIENCFTDEGDYDPARFGTHAHSISCVMSSLAQLADLTGDAPLMEKVRRFYDNGMWRMRDELGWAVENTEPGWNPDRGEANTTGDILETALLLGKWGRAEYYQDAERILRGHLLPCQLRDVSFIRDAENPGGEDAMRDVANRHLGAFGFPAPYGHRPVGQHSVGFNMDIVGGAVASLCEAYRQVTSYENGVHRVNLLFDRETPEIRVESPYTHPKLTVTVGKPGPLLVRIPPWADRARVTVEGAPPGTWSGDWLFFDRPGINRPIRIGFQLVSREITLRHRTRDIRVRLRGDEVAAMDAFGQDLTYFDPIEG